MLLLTCTVVTLKKKRKKKKYVSQNSKKNKSSVSSHETLEKVNYSGYVSWRISPKSFQQGIWHCTVSLIHAPVILCHGGSVPKAFSKGFGIMQSAWYMLQSDCVMADQPQKLSSRDLALCSQLDIRSNQTVMVDQPKKLSARDLALYSQLDICSSKTVSWRISPKSFKQGTIVKYASSL